jgi:uncharacterized membrane protein YheB (UPF0754 family)
MMGSSSQDHQPMGVRSLVVDRVDLSSRQEFERLLRKIHEKELKIGKLEGEVEGVG